MIQILSELYEKYQDDIIAIGESGLDYYWLKKISQEHNISREDFRQIQKDFFIAQIRLAQKLKLPLIIHNREASKDIFEILKTENFTNFVFHCYSEDLKFAQKVEQLGADAIIAVNNEAGGHRGNKTPEDLIKELVSHCNIPVISAGGVGCKADIDKMLSYGAEGVSVGSPFIASTEANVTDEYKQACVDYGAKDIVMTERISGTPCTVINTPYVQKIGTKATWLESVLNKNKKLKKWVKMIRFSIGMKATKNAAKKLPSTT